MNETELDRRLGALLRDPAPASDPAFADRVVAAARIDRDIRLARRRAWRRAVAESAAAIVVAGSFYLLSQEQGSLPDGMMSLYGPAMAGLVMLGLWAAVSFPISGSQPQPA